MKPLIACCFAFLSALSVLPALAGEFVTSSCNPCIAGEPITLEIVSSPPLLQAAHFVLGERGGPGTLIGVGTLSGTPPASQAVLVISSLAPGTYRIRADYVAYCLPPDLCPAVVQQTDAITQLVLPSGAAAAMSIPTLDSWALAILALVVGYAGLRSRRS